MNSTHSHLDNPVFLAYIATYLVSYGSRMNASNERRIGIVSVIVYEPDKAYQKLNDILHEYGPIILGRMGMPYRERSLSIIALIVEGSTDEIGAMTGRIGQLESVSVKSSFAKTRNPH